jgi:hypothetical protein
MKRYTIIPANMSQDGTQSVNDCKNNNTDRIIDCTRANNNCLATFGDSARMEKATLSFNENRFAKHDINIKIYRFKFTDDFMDVLHIFAKVHQYDHRKVFKEAWELWLEENDTIVSAEVQRLTELNYNGDIIDKMFKSARYYFRKKSTEKKEPLERRSYISGDKELIDAMDMHILENIEQANYKPSDGFDDFCKTNIDLLQKEVNYLCRCGMKNSNEMKEKIKKTYKNRYFLISTK